LGRVGVIVLGLVCSLLIGGCNGGTSNRGSLNAGQKDFTALGAKLSSQELLYIFNQDISSKGVIRRLGEPAEKSAAVVWGADGLEHQSWFYYTKGIELDMVRDNGMQTINSLKAYADSALRTSRNIGIGSSKAAVLAAYQKEINFAEVPQEASAIVVGSVYGGVILQIADNQVTSIFIGAAAE